MLRQMILSVFAFVLSTATAFAAGTGAIDGPGQDLRSLPPIGEVIEGSFAGCMRPEDTREVIRSPSRRTAYVALTWKLADRKCVGYVGRARVKAYRGVFIGGDYRWRCVVKVRIVIRPWMDEKYLYVAFPVADLYSRVRCASEDEER